MSDSDCAPAAADSAADFVAGARTARRRLGEGLAAIEGVFDRVFAPDANPWRHLGALGFWLFWIVAATGIYVYVAFDTRADGAYDSVQRLSHDDFPLGSLARSLHRYAADAFLVVALLHLVREWLRGRYAHVRCFSWITGVIALGLIYASGIGGYWLVWDAVAQYSLVATGEWLDALPLAGELARNFDSVSKVTDRLFSLLVFLHIGIPLLLLAFMWLHLQRLSRPASMPPRALAWGTSAALVALALGWPVASSAPADPSRIPAMLALDWFYLGVHPLADAIGPVASWLVLALGSGSLLVLPWMSREARAPRPLAARVDRSQCSGCARCVADCPYGALMMQAVAHRGGASVAVVDAARCAACGICAGACPSSTPFRSDRRLVSGIDLPQHSLDALRARLNGVLAQWRATPRGTAAQRIVVFACATVAPVEAHTDGCTAAIEIVCAGQLPPSFIDYALRAGADGVLVSRCGDGDCAYRFGDRCSTRRLERRWPFVTRGAVPMQRIREAPGAAGSPERLRAALIEFRHTLATLAPAASRQPKRTEGNDHGHLA